MVPSTPVHVLRAAAPRGGVVLVGEAFGPDDALRSWADALVHARYDVAIPDLWWRSGGPPPREGVDAVRDAVARLSDFEALADIAAARDRLSHERPKFVLGFCIGGLYARLAACVTPGLTGAVEFYGRIRYGALSANKPAQPLDLLPGLACPLLAHFGDADPIAPRDQVEELRRRLEPLVPCSLVHLYPGCGHAFMNDATPAWNPAAARTAWSRSVAFLDHLSAAAG